jgi:heptosyltransferase-2
MPSLVIQTSFFGDLILTTPLIAELATRGPVDVVATPQAAPILAHNPDIRRLVPFDKRGTHRGLSGMRLIAAAVRADDARAAAYCVQGSLRTGVLAILAGYRHRVGFETSAGRWLYTTRVPHPMDRHYAARVLGLATGGTGIAPAGDLLRPRVYPGAAEREVVDSLLGDAGHRGEPLVALAPGSIWGTKRWPWYAELAARLPPDVRPAVVGSGDDLPLADAICHATGGRAIVAAGRLSLLGSAELLSRAVLLVANDSAPTHLASAVGTPTLTLFGPTVPAFGFGPLAPESDVMGHPGLPCRPCHTHGPAVCPLDHWRCMRELSVDAVADRALAMLRARAA